MEVTKHFVVFQSPGTFVAEESQYEIDSWSVAKAIEMSKSITERYNATPFRFYFKTMGRRSTDLDSKCIKTSCNYYLGGKIRTYEDVMHDNLPNEEILRSNMKNNDMKRIHQTTSGWSWTSPLEDDDVVLQM